MKISIHQPQYIPWVPYFLKIESSDLFIILDTVSFQKNGLQNRNQIKTAQGASWLTVPVKHNLGQKIIDTKIDNHCDWKRKHWNTISQCYSKASFFKIFEEEMRNFYISDWDNLCEFNIKVLQLMLLWMGITTPIIRSSQMKATGSSSDLILNLCIESQATEYLSGEGGKSYLIEEDFKNCGINISYQNKFLSCNYPQLFPKKDFINHLSALDLILNCGNTWRDYV